LGIGEQEGLAHMDGSVAAFAALYSWFVCTSAAFTCLKEFVYFALYMSNALPITTQFYFDYLKIGGRSGMDPKQTIFQSHL
jgi:hypothetical protein